jgi:hypothetical protein
MDLKQQLGSNAMALQTSQVLGTRLAMWGYRSEFEEPLRAPALREVPSRSTEPAFDLLKAVTPEWPRSADAWA